MKIAIIYYSGTGCTEKMAEIIEDELSKNEDLDIILKEVKNAEREDIESSEIILFGSPALGPERVEEYVMEPYIQSTKELFKEKKFGLFGSYDWGDGKWMRDWVERMKDYGGIVHKDGCIVKLYPDEEDEIRIREYVKDII